MSPYPVIRRRLDRNPADFAEEAGWVGDNLMPRLNQRAVNIGKRRAGWLDGEEHASATEEGLVINAAEAGADHRSDAPREPTLPPAT